MILQGVGHPVPYLGVSYANDPQKGGYMAYAPALDLTTLFEVILQPSALTVLDAMFFLGSERGYSPSTTGHEVDGCKASKLEVGAG